MLITEIELFKFISFLSRNFVFNEATNVLYKDNLK